MDNTSNTTNQTSELIPVSNSKVSNVFLANTKEYGKQFMFDGKDETCWSSEQGNKNINIQVCFEKNTSIKYCEIISQGGYCPKVYFILKFMK